MRHVAARRRDAAAGVGPGGLNVEGIRCFDAEFPDARAPERAGLQALGVGLLAGEQAIAEAVGLQQVAAHVEQPVGFRRVAAALGGDGGEVALAQRQRQHDRQNRVGRLLAARELRQVRSQRGRPRQRIRPADAWRCRTCRSGPSCAAPARSASAAPGPAPTPRPGACRACGSARARRRRPRSCRIAPATRRRRSSSARCAGRTPCRAGRCRRRCSRPRPGPPGRAPAS